MSDEQDRAEALDADELGDDPYHSDELPGENYPPDRPSGIRSGEFAADGSIAEDDLERRQWREQMAEPLADQGIDLLDDTGLDELDDEEALIADRSERDGGSDVPAEVAAVHLVDDESPLEDRP